MTFKRFFNYLYDSIDLSDSNNTDIFKTLDISVSLRYASRDYDWFFGTFRTLYQTIVKMLKTKPLT